MGRPPRPGPGALALLLFAAAPSAAAHGFGQRYDLPVPLTLYLAGAGAAVLLSFVVVAFFLRGAGTPGGYPRLDLLRFAPVRLLASRPVVALVRTLSVALFGLVLVAGLIGTPVAAENLAPAVVWVIWWVGVAYASALVGNVWALLNPWKILFEWAEAVARRVDRDAELSLGLTYPRALGVWPAVGLFLAFAWLELVFPEPGRPANIATAMLLYSAVTWGGMALFGKETWLRHGEAFSLAFGLLARFAPTELRVTSPAVCAAHCDGCPRGPDGCVGCVACFEAAAPAERELALRPYAAGLLRDEGTSLSMTAFVVLLLSTVTFDGFTATPAWATLFTSAYAALPSLTWIGTLGLLAFPLLFLALYGLTCAFMTAAARSRLPLLRVARAFVLTLVPIALAYHLAHYLSYLLVQSQLLVPLASDPFGFGWDLFGTADYTLDLNVVGARFAWYTAVVAIVLGHIVAVWLAHVRALRLFGSHRAALLSQLPMMLLMVAYTVISLWILAQPIVEVSLPG